MSIEFVFIHSGEFIMGTKECEVEEIVKQYPEFETKLLEREIPQCKIWTDSYYISKYEITNDDFAEFIADTKYITTAENKGESIVFNPTFAMEKSASWSHPLGKKSDIRGKGKHPVTQVSWDDTQAFCSWLSTKSGKKYRLPTEAEWERAARGCDGRIFPWGNVWNESYCNSNNRYNGTTPVNKFSKYNISSDGCIDMCGNVFEWTSTNIGNTEPWPSKYVYPYQHDDGRESITDRNRKIGRGGSYSRNSVYCRCAFRFADLPTDSYSTQGFRVVLEP